MGIDYRVRVGIFIDVPPVQTEVTPAKRGCSRGCPGELSASANFCAHCGSPATVTRPAKVALGTLSLADLPAHVEKLWFQPPYASGLGPNHAVFAPESNDWGVTIRADESDTRSLNSANAPEAIARFEIEHASLLEYILKTYAVQPRVHWGAVAYAY